MSSRLDQTDGSSIQITIAWIAGYLQGLTGVRIQSDVPTFIKSRLLPVQRRHGLAGLRELRDALAGGDPAVTADAVDALTTHETSFNRDIGVFKWLEQHAIPDLLAERGAERPLSIWSAGCSSGEEPLSVAMILAKMVPEPAWLIRATDVSASTIARASKGMYTGMQVNRGLRARQLLRWFSRTGMAYRASDALMRGITWETHNLIKDPPPGRRIDLVLMRNVLIYFNDANRMRAVECVAASLRPGGILVTGGAESMMGCLVNGPFERGSQGTVSYWRRK